MGCMRINIQDWQHLKSNDSLHGLELPLRILHVQYSMSVNLCRFPFNEQSMEASPGLNS